MPKRSILPPLRLPKRSASVSGFAARLFGRSDRPDGDEGIDSVIAAGTVVRGDITFSGVLRIDGTVEGRLEAGGDRALLVVGDGATLRGDVFAVDAVLCGKVEGNVVIQRFLELRPGARVIGDVTYRHVEMHVGAAVDGRMVHVEDGAKAPSGPLPGPSTPSVGTPAARA